MLNEHGRLSVDTLAEKLSVSAMTVNRDIRELAEDGKIRRLHGIILLPDGGSQSNECALCRREISERIQFLYLFPSGKTISYCCPHCGLAQMPANSGASAVFTMEFLYGSLIDAYSAVYLVGSRINVCCSPSMLCFKDMQDALDFQKGFGGEILSLQDAVRALFQSNPMQ